MKPAEAARLPRPARRGWRQAVADSCMLGLASLAAYWLADHVLSALPEVSAADDALGGLWAVIATIFVFRDSYQQSISAAASRVSATSVSFILCLIYLMFLPFHAWALALLVGLSALTVTVAGRPGDVPTAGITTASSRSSHRSARTTPGSSRSSGSQILSSALASASAPPGSDCA